MTKGYKEVERWRKSASGCFLTHTQHQKNHPCKFVSYQQNFIHTYKLLYSHLPIFFTPCKHFKVNGVNRLPLYIIPYWYEYSNIMRFIPNIYYSMFHTPWCELDMSCLKCLKQVPLGVKKFCWCENKFANLTCFHTKSTNSHRSVV